MGVVLWILVILVGGLIGILCLVMLAPIHLMLDAGSITIRFKLRFLFVDLEYDKSMATTRLMLFNITVIRVVSTVEKKEEKQRKKEMKEQKKADKKERKAKKKGKKKRRKKSRVWNFWGAVQKYPDVFRKWLKQLFLLMVRIIGALRIDYFRANAVIATPDPYWTGVIYGYSEALRSGLQMIPRVDISLRPDFQTLIPKGDISLSITYRMYRLTWALIQFLRVVPKWGSIGMIRTLTRSAKSAWK